MQLGSLELQIFVALFLVLGSAFVALVCDFLKGNNEQLREKNIELRVRQDERERLGFFQPLAHPIAWLQGLADLVRNPGGTAAQPAPAAAAPAARDASARPVVEESDLENLTGAAQSEELSEENRTPTQRRHRYDEFKAAAKHQSWATKEELEQLAGRAARIRARHEASRRKLEEPALGLTAPMTPAAALEAVELRRPRLTELPRLEQVRPVATVSADAAPMASPALEEEAAGPSRVVVERASAAAEQTPQADPEQPKPVVVPVPEAELASPPPMAQHPVATPWRFPQSGVLPPEPGLPATPADLIPSPVVGPESSQLVSLLPTIEEPVTDEFAPEPAIESAEPLSVEIEPGSTPREPVPAVVFAEPTPVAETEEEPIASQAALPELVAQLPVTEPAVAPELVVDELTLTGELDEVQAVFPPIRTRIRPIDVTPVEEMETEDVTIAAPAPQAAAEPAPQPPAPQSIVAAPKVVARETDIPRIEARPVETVLPSLDVAALQKATGESRPASLSLPSEGTNEAKLEIPAGLHEPGVLAQLLGNQTPFSGVVVAIGLNDYETLRDKLASGADSMAALNKMVLSMLRPQDFACRFQDDEYILIYPGERGSSAQRRLFQVSEKLWDFQLRSLGNLSVMFSWGGLEVTSETLAEAVASARERMYQTKRNRKPSGLEFASTRKKIANG